MAQELSQRERILRQLRGQEIDRLPRIGGWMLGVRNLAAIAAISVDDYLRDPVAGVLRANRALGVDAMCPPVIPRDVNSIRAGQLEQATFAGVEPEVLLEPSQRGGSLRVKRRLRRRP